MDKKKHEVAVYIDKIEWKCPDCGNINSEQDLYTGYFHYCKLCNYEMMIRTIIITDLYGIK